MQNVECRIKNVELRIRAGRGAKMRKRLTKRQLAVLDELFGSDAAAGEQQILEKHKVIAAEYIKWHSQEAFAEEYEARLAALGRQSRLLIARYASFAAAKLIALTESENQETARKACLDIIDRIQNLEARSQNAEDGGRKLGLRSKNEELTEVAEGQLSPEVAEKILAVLAERG